MTLKKLTRGNRTMQKKFKAAGIDIVKDGNKDTKKDADDIVGWNTDRSQQQIEGKEHDDY